jgi:cobalt/nickel transport system permease protein
MLAAGTAWGEWGIDEISSIVSNGSVLGYITEGMKQGFVLSPIMPDYTIRGIPDLLAYSMTAIIGALLSIAIFQIVKRSSANFVKTNLQNTKF